MSLISRKVQAISPSITLALTAKAKSLKKEGVDVINFAAGEPDFDTPQFIKKAAIAAIDSGFTKYTPESGTPELKKAICDKLSRDNGLDYEPDQVVVSCGAKHALYNLFQTICEDSDEVIVPSPYWLSYPEIVRLAGATPVIAATDKATFTITAGSLEKYITKKTKAVILNSPSNPTGAVYNKDVLAGIAELALKRGIFIVSDEIYEKLIYDSLRHISIASLGGKIYGQTFVINGVSKSYSMTGWRIGYVAGKKEVMHAISALQGHSTSNPASISQAAALAAISAENGQIKKMADEFQKRRDALYSGLSGIKRIRPFRPQGAFYCFADVSATGMDGATFAERLLEKKHVAAIPGEPFGASGWVRFSFATSIESIRDGVERIREWVRQ